MLDLIVIGAGLTGLMAAHTAAQAGLKVKVIAKGLGALHWSAGTVDVLGYYPDERTLVQRESWEPASPPSAPGQARPAA